MNAIIEGVVAKELKTYSDEHGFLRELIRITEQVYDPDDEVRLPYDDPEIDFDWRKGPAIK
ncbi:hypothetical protein ACFL36_04490 [Thermodesulfobacteriota bacterium]